MSSEQTPIPKKTLMQQLDEFPAFFSTDGSRWYKSGKLEPITQAAVKLFRANMGLHLKLFEAFHYYADMTTYEAPRLGGVLSGCPRGKVPTPDQLVEVAKTAMEQLRKFHAIEDYQDELVIPAAQSMVVVMPISEYDALQKDLERLRNIEKLYVEEMLKECNVP